MDKAGLPYPWTSEGPGLVPVLRDSEFLAEAFKDAPKGFQQDVVSIAPPQSWSTSRGSLIPKGLGLVSNRDIGRGLLHILIDPERRKKLIKLIEKHAAHKQWRDARHFIANHLCLFINKKFDRFLPRLDEVCNSTRSPYYISVDKFREWLCDSPQASLEGTRAIALFACSFAVLQPAIACDLLTILVEAGSAFGDLLLDEVSEDNRTEDCGNSNRPLGTLLHSNSEASRPTSLPELSNASDSEKTYEVGLDDKVAQTLASQDLHGERKSDPGDIGYSSVGNSDPEAETGSTGADCLETAVEPMVLGAVSRLIHTFEFAYMIPFREVCDFVSQASERLGSLKQRIESLEKLKRRVERAWGEARNLPWLQRQLESGTESSADDALTIDQQFERLEEIASAFAGIQQAHERLLSLVQRFDEIPSPFIPPDEVGLAAILSQLEVRAEEYAARLKEIDRREQRVAEFLDQIVASEVEFGTRLVREGAADLWADLICFILGPAPRTEPGRAYGRLSGRLDLAKVALAQAWSLDPEGGPTLIESCLSDDNALQDTLVPLLAYLAIEQVCQIAVECPSLLPGISEAIVAASLGGDLSLLHYLEPFCDSQELPGSCARFYRQVIGLWRRNALENPRVQLCPERTVTEADGHNIPPNYFEGLVQDTETKNRGAVSLLSTLRKVCSGELDPCVPHSDFGTRCVGSTENVVMLRDPISVVSPFMLHGWPLVVAGRPVTLADHLYDYLCLTTALRPRVNEDVIQYYLDRHLYLAARRAAEHFESQELADLVDAEFGVAWSRIEQSYEGLQAEVRTINDDTKIADLCALLEAALLRLDIDESRTWLDELAQARDQYRLRCDPMRQELVQFLLEARLPVPDVVSNEQLEAIAEGFRQANPDRRYHVEYLRELSNDQRLPASVRGAWSVVADAIDHPAAWPPADFGNSLKLAEAMETFSSYIIRRWEQHNVDPRTGDLAERLGVWVSERLMEGLTAQDTNALEAIYSLADEIERFCHDRVVWKAIESSPPVQLSSALHRPPAARADTRQSSNAIQQVPNRKVSSEAITEELRASIQEYLDLEPIQGRVVEAKRLLRRASQGGRWVEARGLAVSLLREPGGDWFQGRMTDEAVVYTVSILESPGLPADKSLAVLQLACLAAAHRPNRSLDYYISRETINSLVPKWVLALAGSADERQVPEALALALTNLMESSFEPQRRAFSELLWKASQVKRSDDITGSAWLAEQLWDALTSHRDSTGRSELLNLLFAIQRQETLSYLAGKAREPLDDLIRSYVRLFFRAENDDASAADAAQAAVNFEERSRSQPNTIPWKRLFKRLSGAQSRSTGPKVTIHLDSDILDQPHQGRYLLRLRLVPSYADPPRSLQIEIGGEKRSELTRLVHEYEPLVDEKSIDIEISIETLNLSSGCVHIPYHAFGITIDQQPIDVRNEWIIPNPQLAGEPIPDETILRHWPGASGEEVKRDKGFHGRDREIKKIETLLIGDRPRSVMVVGQRRIGKTSLLWQLLDSFPPSERRVVAGYCTMTLPDLTKDSLSRVFFDTIVSALEKNPKNKPIQQAIKRHGGEPTNLSEQLRKARSVPSISDALEHLVDHLEQITGGEIRRLALLIDEFDRFVEPLMTGRKDEVESLMWGLRPLIMNSPRIGLVLAGSGLQRVFVDRYDQALFGSIPLIELLPFDWDQEHDRVASQETFLPSFVRARLCPGELFEDVSHYAHQLCGGVPYYLAMLGSSAAASSRGYKYTRAALDRVVDRILHDEFRAADGRQQMNAGMLLDPKLFYMPIFDSLNALPARQRAICQVLLARVAVRTTKDYPWIRRSEVVEGPEIGTTTDEMERFDALNKLVSLRALDSPSKDTSRVRIRVPITRSALALHAMAIIEEARIEIKCVRATSQ